MSKQLVPKGTIGAQIVVTIKDETGTVVNISSATQDADRKIYLIKPNNEVLTKQAVFMTDGTDGKLKYATIANDLDSVGVWKFHGWVNLVGGTFPTTMSEFEVVKTAITP